MKSLYSSKLMVFMAIKESHSKKFSFFKIVFSLKCETAQLSKKKYNHKSSWFQWFHWIIYAVLVLLVLLVWLVSWTTSHESMYYKMNVERKRITKFIYRTTTSWWEHWKEASKTSSYMTAGRIARASGQCFTTVSSLLWIK